MKKNLEAVLLGVSIAVSLSACVSNATSTATHTTGAQTTSQMSLSQAVGTLRNMDFGRTPLIEMGPDPTASLSLGAPSNLRSRTAVRAIGGNVTEQYVDQPYQLDVQLPPGQAGDIIRSAGQPVFLYIVPQMIVQRKSVLSSGRTEDFLGRQQIILPDHDATCEGYLMVLHPDNDYRISIHGTQEFIIRRESLPGQFSRIALRYEQANPKAITTHASLSPFRVSSSQQRRPVVSSGNHQGTREIHTVPSMIAKACYFLPQRDLWRS